MNLKKLFHLAIIVVPVLVMMGWLLTHALSSQDGTTVTLPVEGYDPRDILMGHYITYRVDYGAKKQCDKSGPTCLCLKKAREHHELDYAYTCGDERVSCNLPIKGSCYYGNFIAGIEKYYFPEAYRSELKVIPPNSSIVVRLSKDGKPYLIDMRVGDQQITEWAKAQQEAKGRP